MPGLVGVVGEGRTAEGDVALRRMCGALRGERPLEVRTYVGPEMALGRVVSGIFGKGPMILERKDGLFCLVMDGEVYVDGGSGVDVKSVVDVLVEDAERGAQRLRGSFVVVVWDGRRKTLMMVNDRYGLRPMYYSLWEGRLLFSSEVKGVLAYPSFSGRVDDRGVSDLLCFGHLLEHRTLFEGIAVLPAGTILKYGGGDLSLEKYWDFTFAGEEDRSEEAYEADLADLLMQAVRRAVVGEDRIGVPLSGGLDSRTIAAGAVRAREGIHTFTFGERTSPDARIASNVADRLGTVHHFFEMGPEDLMEGAATAIWLSDGMLNWRHAYGLNVFPYMRAYADVVLVGMQLLGSFLSRRFQRCEDDEALLRGLFNPLETEQRKRLCSSEFFEQTEESIAASLEVLRGSAAHLRSPIDRWDYWDLTQRQRRFILMGQVLMRNDVETRCPLFDYDLMDFVLRVPARLRVNQRLYVRAFCRLFPELARIPWERTGWPVRAAWWRVRLRQIGRTIVDRGLGYSRRRFRRGSLGNLGAWYREDRSFRGFVRDLLLSSQAKQRGYFNGAAVEKLLDDPWDNLEVVGRLVTLELGWRLFVNPSSYGKNSGEHIPVLGEHRTVSVGARTFT